MIITKLCSLLAILLFASALYAQRTQDDKDAEDLAKATQNPVANLISVPFQNNNNFGIGPYNRTQDDLNIQPVIPVKISEKWMIINRIIQPIIWQPYSTQNTGGEYGFGDMNPTFFLSPVKAGKLIWGVGPALVLPTATSNILGQGKVSIGPAVVLLAQPGHWTVGLLTNNVWSFAGSGSRPDVNQFLIQPFVNYNMRHGYFLSSSPVITANWNNQPSPHSDGTIGSNRWTSPVGGGVGRITRLGYQPISWEVEFYGNAAHTVGGASWNMRLEFTLLYPEKKK